MNNSVDNLKINLLHIFNTGYKQFYQQDKLLIKIIKIKFSTINSFRYYY